MDSWNGPNLDGPDRYADVHPIASRREGQQDQRPVVTIPITSLQLPDSPRLAGESADHVRVLAESEIALPPIIVSRSTMRVIDGMHRLRAALLRGQEEIEVQLFEGDEEDAFVLAVEANVNHGLPLSLADRTAAAARIVKSHLHWSDRAIASSTGLAAKTVAAIRRRSTADNPQSNNRIGRDGRIRPPNAVEGRRTAAKLMADKPDTPLREIAHAAGISLGTAQNVRARLRRGEDPIALNQHEDEQRDQSKFDGLSTGASTTVDRIHDNHIILQRLRKDPSLRSTETGRLFIRMLHPLTLTAKEWEQLIHDLPGHCTVAVSDAARACAQTWEEVAARL
jgi:ParB-like chromosome segregation protein Spo0J